MLCLSASQCFLSGGGDEQELLPLSLEEELLPESAPEFANGESLELFPALGLGGCCKPHHAAPPTPKAPAPAHAPAPLSASAATIGKKKNWPSGSTLEIGFPPTYP